MLIEASALGVPIAAMNTGGTPDIVVARGDRPALDDARRLWRTTCGGCAHDERAATAARRGGTAARRRTVRCRRGRRRASSSSIASSSGGARREPADPRRRRRALGVSAARRTAGSSARLRPGRAISLTRGVEVTLITRDRRRPDAAGSRRRTIHPRDHASTRCRIAPFRSPDGAARRCSIAARRIRCSASAPAAWRCDLVQRGRRSISSTGFGASVLGYARQRAHVSRRRRSCSTRRGWRSSAPPIRRERGSSALAYLPLRRAVLVVRARRRPRHRDRPRARAGRARSISGFPPDRIVTSSRTPSICAWSTRWPTAADGARVRRAAGIGDDETVLLSVGRLEENKGFHVLAAALGALRDHAHGDRRRALALGDRRRRPVPRPRSTRAIAAAGIAERTLLAGRLDDRDAARVVRGGDAVRAPDAVRRQLARHARSHGAPARRRRHDRRRAARQGRAGPQRLAGAAWRRLRARGAISGALGPDVDLPALGRHGRRASSASSRGMPRRNQRFSSIGSSARARRKLTR